MQAPRHRAQLRLLHSAYFPVHAASAGSRYLLGAALQHLFIVLAICPPQVGAQALRRLIGQLDAVLQETDGQGALQ